ncbi:MAG: hypothetical protein MGG11_11490 [Trichodesmium sp. MAG_R03]|nr:hypothetical protein [Trichodesmium sp. MAG_R03]
MYKYILILSIIFVSSVLTGLSITPEITSIEQLQSEPQRWLELIAGNYENNNSVCTNNNSNDSTIIQKGKERDDRKS